MHALALAVVTLITAAPDTLVALRPGDRLSATDLAGEITIVAWERPELRVTDEDEPGDPLPLVRRGERLLLDGREEHRELRLEVPAWLPLDVRGREATVRIRGTRGAASVRVLDGSVELVDVTGDVEVYTVDGEIRGRDLGGRVRLRSGDEDIRVRGARGSLVASATDGDLVLEDLELDELEASTTEGDVWYAGIFQPGGRYALSTHEGDVVAAVPADADVAVEVSTFSGTFEATFPVTVDRIRSGRRVRFTLGAGGARLVLEAFDGDIRLVRRLDGSGSGEG